MSVLTALNPDISQDTYQEAAEDIAAFETSLAEVCVWWRGEGVMWKGEGRLVEGWGVCFSNHHIWYVLLSILFPLPSLPRSLSVMWNYVTRTKLITK